MKVLFCIPGLTCHPHTRHTLLRAQAMADAGLDLTLFGYPVAVDDHDGIRRMPYVSAFSPRLSRMKARLERRWPMAGVYWRFIVEPFVTQNRGLRYARRNAFDIAYVADTEPWLMFLAWLFNRPWRRRPLVVAFIPGTFYIPSAMKGRPLYSRVKGRLNQGMASRMPRLMPVICDNEFVARDLAGRRPDRVRVVMEGHVRKNVTPDAVAAARRALGLPEGERMLLLFGIATRAKGPDILLRALERVPPRFHVFIVGKTGEECEPSWGDLTALNEKGWGGRIHVVPRFVTEDEKARYHLACDAVVFPYRKGYATSSGNLRDTIDYGKASIVADQYLMGQLVRERGLGLLFPPEDVEGLAHSLREFADKPDAWFDEIRQNAARVVQERSWEQSGVMYRDVFAELLKE